MCQPVELESSAKLMRIERERMRRRPDKRLMPGTTRRLCRCRMLGRISGIWLGWGPVVLRKQVARPGRCWPHATERAEAEES
jgi:hypothetical protein